MESNRIYHYLFKYAFLGMAIFFWIFPIHEFYKYFTLPENSIDLWSSSLFFLIGCVPLIFFLLLKDKFVLVDLGSQNIKIKKGKSTIERSWLDVECVRQIQFVQPPIYKLTLKNIDGYVLFNTSASYVSVNGFTKDLSEMGILIEKKKRELGF